jgi:hypothetical protein
MVRREAKLEHVVPLSPAAGTIIESVPNLGEFVFTIDGRRATRNFAVELDEACGVSDWRLHDLRRTARSLTSRAGVSQISPIAAWCALSAVSAAYMTDMPATGRRGGLQFARGADRAHHTRARCCTTLAKIVWVTLLAANVIAEFQNDDRDTLVGWARRAEFAQARI